VKISVALCTYNGEEFLREQLDSIGRQTRLPDEVVACDDGSKDDTVEILRAFGEEAPFPVHVHRNQKNLGSTKNFEQAIRLCTGDVIALCDQDDVWLPEKLEKLAAAFRENPATGYVFSDGDLVDEKLHPLARTVWESNRFQGEFSARYVSGDQLLNFVRWPFVTGATMAFRSRLRKYIFPFPDHKIWIHDGWIAVVASAIGEKGLPINESLIMYRQHGHQQIGANLGGEPRGARQKLPPRRKGRQAARQRWIESATFFRHLRKHLSALAISQEPATARSIETLDQFEHFLHNRLKIFSGNTPGRVGLIAGELFSGRYQKFANSWKSALADLLW
jgi:Glycosyl transferase family 2